MDTEENQPFTNLLQTSANQLRHLLQATDVGLWLVTSNQKQLHQMAVSSGKKKSHSFRRQAIPLSQLSAFFTDPLWIEKVTPGETKTNPHMAHIRHFLIAAAHPHSALLLPIHNSDQSFLGVIIALNLKNWKPATQTLTLAATRQVAQQWELSQQFHQLTVQLEEMADQNRQWQAMYNGVQESIVLLDTKAKVLSLNPATEAITGRKASEVIGKHIGELFPKVSPMGSGINFKGRSGLYQTLEERRPSDLFEAIIETKDHRYIWINYTYTPLWDSNGNIIALVRVTSDVSPVKAVEQMKNDFVSIASHELRTPLGVINGYLSLFLAGQLGPLTPDQHTFLERIYHSSSDMSELVEDLLNISRIEAGRLEVDVETFNLNDLISEVITHLEPRYLAKRISVNYTAAKKPLIIKADRQKIEQALTNIIDNAIKYTYDNGTVSVTVASKATDSAVTIAVKDSGVGIKPEHIGHIFEKFYRESNPLSVKEGGSGLGLYISRKLIELHGGTIAVASKAQEGSVFTIRLPLSAQKHSTTGDV